MRSTFGTLSISGVHFDFFKNGTAIDVIIWVGKDTKLDLCAYGLNRPAFRKYMSSLGSFISSFGDVAQEYIDKPLVGIFMVHGKTVHIHQNNNDSFDVLALTNAGKPSELSAEGVKRVDLFSALAETIDLIRIFPRLADSAMSTFAVLVAARAAVPAGQSNRRAIATGAGGRPIKRDFAA